MYAYVSCVYMHVLEITCSHIVMCIYDIQYVHGFAWDIVGVQ